MASTVAAFASAALTVCLSSAAFAQDMSSQASAEVLFTEGRQLMDQGRLAEACTKLGESQRLAPAVGTLLNLGICFEKNHQTASAWATFKEAVSAARVGGQSDRERFAREHAANLEPGLSKLTILIPAASDVTGLEVRRDGLSVGRAVWGSAIPVDPGLHTVDVSAPLKKNWATTVDVGAAAAQALVTVPPLEAAPVTAAPPAAPSVKSLFTPPAPPSEPKRGSTQRTAGVVVGGLGLAAVAIGAVAGLAAKSNNDEALTHCDATSSCDAQGLSLTSRARSDAAVSTVGFGIGGVALITGAVLYLTAPSKKASGGLARLRVAPSVEPRAASLVMGGAW